MAYNPSELAALSQQLQDEVDEQIRLVGDSRAPSWRLGPSSMDTECDRKVWYGFRWVKRHTRDARMYRLLEHGKLMEARFEAMLLAVPGLQLWTIDPNAGPNRLNKQYRIRAVDDHVGAFLDAIAILPPHYGFPDPMVVEMKTGGTGSTWNKTRVDVKAGHPEHVDQFGYYGWKYDFRYSLYVASNKNDDDMTLQIVENDFGKAELLERRMSSVIHSQTPPRRIKEDATFYLCKMCNYADICHKGADYEHNCRSCDYGEPTRGGEWTCNLRSQVIPRDIVPVGCDQYHALGR